MQINPLGDAQEPILARNMVPIMMAITIIQAIRKPTQVIRLGRYISRSGCLNSFLGFDDSMVSSFSLYNEISCNVNLNLFQGLMIDAETVSSFPQSGNKFGMTHVILNSVQDL